MKNIDYQGSHRNLPVSYKCPIGTKGPPGPTGEPGEAGKDGQPGYDGEDYPTAPGHFNDQTSAAAFDEGYGLIAPKSTSQPKCEPCPRGPAGPPGPKGIPGISGPKGDKGIQGVHGIPGVPGNGGPPGNVGPRGKSGRTGLPGPRGADGQAGGKGAPGKPGQTGSVGIPGPRGVSGPTGSVGRDGRRGAVGRLGPKGQRGLDGVDGPQGPLGPPGIDGGYCKCPDRVRDVSSSNYDTEYRSGSYPSSNTYASTKGVKYNSYSGSSSSSYAGKTASAPAAAPRTQEEVQGGSSYQPDQGYGSSVSQNSYSSMKYGADLDPRVGTTSTNNNFYTKELQVGDLPTSSLTSSGYQYSSTQPKTGQYNYQSSQSRAVAPSYTRVQPAASFSPSQDSDEDYPSREWNDRRRRVQAKRQRYVGRS